ncbi:MAG TPA: Rpn family recombination-promoting nuclease/putative transposase [Candidatus Megaira endosymbiont of Nemacystus decipiens]|nr:Rpn family recombination-promoting nuclease/putative transposase [Candidatus Megaera endosymbiont of Nemacystus decipiens]
MTSKKKETNSKNKKSSCIKSDALFKSIMENEIAAREFLTEYLPEGFKALIDLSKVKVEKESFVEEDLKRKLSDIVYSIKTKEGEDAFVYVLVESQSSVDYWMALRLWKYSLLLLERHADKKKNKLPLIAPMLFYNGTKIYNAPKNLWELFTNPAMAKELLTKDYKLIDLQSMSDDEIKQKKHLGMMEFFMKHIYQRDMIKLWEDFLKNFQDVILLDKKNGYIYIKKFLWYTDAKVAEDNKGRLNSLIIDNLPTNDGEEIMRTIADGYIEKGFEKGILQGLEQGIEQGFEKGKLQMALKMLRQGLDMKLVSSVTGLSSTELLQLMEKK